ncbi:30S ribosomal protein S3-like [Molothrus ater]|uniref:30S ribosomal protein S3-like n=1 Tax=Molothrus ater TaxID=84834 RepID=UPI001749ECE9|nr:30S ribosomal protein S3-like [Molothrus ater]
MPPRRSGPAPGPRRPARVAVAAARTPRPHRGARPRRDSAGGPSSSMRSCSRLIGSGDDGNCRRDSARRPGQVLVASHPLPRRGKSWEGAQPGLLT